VRMLVGPTNSAGQGHAWAQAAKTLPDVDAVSFSLHRKGQFQFQNDYGVPLAWFGQPRWQRAQQQHVLASYSHVMVESLRPVFGSRGYPDATPDIEAMLEKGINVSLLFHGSDIRLPSRHAKRVVKAVQWRYRRARKVAGRMLPKAIKTSAPVKFLRGNRASKDLGKTYWGRVLSRRDVMATIEKADVVVALDAGAIWAGWNLGQRRASTPVVLGIPAARRELDQLKASPQKLKAPAGNG